MTDTTQATATAAATDTTSTASDASAAASTKPLFDAAPAAAPAADTTAGGQSQDTVAGGQDTTQGGDAKDTTEGGDAKPIEYADFTLPDGFVAIPEQMEWVKEFGKSNGLSQEAAQGIISKYVEIQQQQLADWQTLKNQWADEVTADPTYGGNNLQKAQAKANSVIQRFGDNALVDDLVELGLGNKLSVMRFLNKVADAIGEDTSGGNDAHGGGGAPKSAIEALQARYEA